MAELPQDSQQNADYSFIPFRVFSSIEYGDYADWLISLLANCIKNIHQSCPNKEKCMTTSLVASEYFINLIRFSVDDREQFGPALLHTIRNTKVMVTSLDEILNFSGHISDNRKKQMKYIGECFHDLSTALEESNRQRGAGATSSATAISPPVPWEPFLNSPGLFSSEIDKVFMKRLRRIYIRVFTTHPRIILRELEELFSATDTSQLRLSEVMTDTAMRSIHFIFSQIRVLQMHENLLHVQDLRDISFRNLVTFCESLNRPDHLQEKETHCDEFRIYVYQRQQYVSMLKFLLIQRVTADPPTPIHPSTPNHERIPGSPPSTLWQKLLAAGSLEVLTKGKGEEMCSICHERNMTQKNFSLLDICDHIFCAECISMWFTISPTCPICRTKISSFTTRDDVVAFKNSRRQIFEGHPILQVKKTGQK